MALGSLICALPHWMVDIYHPDVDTLTNQTDFGQCANRDDPECTGKPYSSYFNPYFWMFILGRPTSSLAPYICHFTGQTLHGVGSTPLFSIGTTYMDENVSQKASPVYLAIHAVLTSFGPVIGVFAGGFLLNLYDDFDRVERYELDVKLSPHCFLQNSNGAI